MFKPESAVNAGRIKSVTKCDEEPEEGCERSFDLSVRSGSKYVEVVKPLLFDPTYERRGR